mmetsp:Transcript_21869/g.48015  ORF Transcript_21869/g.48015 Transcript_21869/m.48015 type:complete len:306 (-) Transcript_21869:716-1633(-)
MVSSHGLRGAPHASACRRLRNRRRHEAPFRQLCALQLLCTRGGGWQRGHQNVRACSESVPATGGPDSREEGGAVASGRHADERAGREPPQRDGYRVQRVQHPADEPAPRAQRNPVRLPHRLLAGGDRLPGDQPGGDAERRGVPGERDARARGSAGGPRGRRPPAAAPGREVQVALLPPPGGQRLGREGERAIGWAGVDAGGNGEGRGGPPHRPPRGRRQPGAGLRPRRRRLRQAHRAGGGGGGARVVPGGHVGGRGAVLVGGLERGALPVGAPRGGFGAARGPLPPLRGGPLRPPPRGPPGRRPR